ncbi:MAG: L,D-transpeptidase [Chlorobi bacterium]|nr:L,D-transpeptidase [Chlorobiota bacterium]
MDHPERSANGWVVDSAAVALAERNAQLIRRHKELSERFPLINYRVVVLHSRRQRDSLLHAFGVGRSADSAKVLATLNRKELRFLRVGDSVVVPDRIETDLRAYSVFPQFYPQAVDIPKLILLSNKYQAYACYTHGELVRFAACNSGSKSKPTLPGRYYCNWKQRERVSSLNDEWVLPFTINFHQYAGCAFHAFEMPGRPVSHACVRQFLDDAEWLYRWVRTGNMRDSIGRFYQLGTPVIILDMFDYRRRQYGPWVDLRSNRELMTDLPLDPLAVEEPWIPISQIPHKIRRGLPGKRRYMVARDTLLARGIIDSTFRFRESVDYNELRRQRNVEHDARKRNIPPVMITPASPKP